MSLGWGRTGQGDQVRLGLAIELGPPAWTGLPAARERGFQAFLEEAPPGALDRCAPDLQAGRDGLVAAARVGEQQRAGATLTLRFGAALVDDGVEAFALLRRELHLVDFGHKPNLHPPAALLNSCLTKH